MKNEPTTARLRIVLEKPTAGVDFGLQRGRGSDYEVVAKQRSKGGDLEFRNVNRNDSAVARSAGLGSFSQRLLRTVSAAYRGATLGSKSDSLFSVTRN
jgi:hypothetical protein